MFIKPNKSANTSTSYGVVYSLSLYLSKRRERCFLKRVSSCLFTDNVLSSSLFGFRILISVIYVYNG